MKRLFFKYWGKTLLILSMGILAFIAFVFIRLFFLMDPSGAPLETDELKEPLYLISYADGPDVFHKNQKILAYSALRKGVSHFFNYKKYMIDPEFLENHKETFAQKSGAGYWLWKPWIIQDALKKIPENAYVFYCDSGFLVKGDVRPILSLLKKNDMVLVAYTNKKMFGTLGQNVKKEALIKMHCNEEKCQDSFMIWAGMLFMKNTPATRSFIQKWLAYCEDPDLLWPQGKDSKSHHHYDQALLSVTYYKNPKHITLVSDEDVCDHILKWHHRHPNDEYTLFFHNDRVRGVERDLLHTRVFKTIAKWVYKFSESKPSKSRPLKPVF